MTTNSVSSMRDIFLTILSRRMLVVFLQGFACGVPYLLTGAVMQAWLKDECVSIEHISLFGLVMLPYSLKFVWAPLLDRFTLPFLGRRRGWLIVIQICLGISIMALGQNDPLASPWLLALTALILVFFAASQDIVVDAHRRETLPDHELGLGSAAYVQAYRIGMLLASGGGLILADQPGWDFADVYMVLGATIFIGVLSTLLSREPVEAHDRPRTLRDAVIEPFKEFFTRRDAILILLFILLYKFGDSMAGHLTTPFYLDMGYTKTDVGVIAKLYGTIATIVGTIVGAIVMIRIGLFKGLFIFGIFQMVSTFGFVLMAASFDVKEQPAQADVVGPAISIFAPITIDQGLKPAAEVAGQPILNEITPLWQQVYQAQLKKMKQCVPLSKQRADKAARAAKKAEQQASLQLDNKMLFLTLVISIENLAAGMGTAAFLAFMASLANRRFTATQYALLTSFMAVSANLLNAPGGYFVKAFGWEAFFTFCVLIAIPGLLLLVKFRSWIGKPLENEEPSPQTS